MQCMFLLLHSDFPAHKQSVPQSLDPYPNVSADVGIHSSALVRSAAVVAGSKTLLKHCFYRYVGKPGKQL